MPTRLMVHMRDGAAHTLDFDTDQEASAALQEVNDAMAARAMQGQPTTIAGRLVVRPADVRSAELTDSPSGPGVF